MRGKEVFYPVGWDDNGLATERRVQNYFGVRCDPSLPYQSGLVPPCAGGGGGGSTAARQVPVSRRNFVELCRQLTELDERAYEDAWRRLGLSVDWSMSYRTIEDGPKTISQRAFLRSLARGQAYPAEGPALWDVSFGSAVAQAEIEDRQMPGTYWSLAFRLAARTRRRRCGTGSSRPPGPSCCPRASRWSRIPTTSGIALCSGPRH